MQLLVSIKSIEECNLVLSSGISLIDIKDTSYGALAPLNIQLTEEIMLAIKHYRSQYPDQLLTISATIGDVCDTVEDLKLLMDERYALGIDVIKLPATIWNCDKFSNLISDYLLNGRKLIAIFTPQQLNKSSDINAYLKYIADHRYLGVMVDTIDKGISLTGLLDRNKIETFVIRSQALGLTVGLAGGLRIEDYDLLHLTTPNFMGFRSGLCESFARGGSLCAEKLHLLKAKIV